MNLGVVLNEAYIKYLYVMLVSFLESNADRHIRIFVTYECIEEQKLDAFSDLEEKYDCEICFLCLDNVVFPEYLVSTDNWPMTIYYHLLFADLLPEEIDRILYLDTDVIVHGDMTELYETDFDDNYLVACDDMTLQNGYDDLSNQQKKLFEEYKQDFRYFNTGMMLLNLKKIRDNFNFTKWMKLAKDKQGLLFAPDQDMVNIGFWGKVKYVDCLKYNMMAKISYNRGISLEWIRENNIIVHYAGRKPWQHESVRYTHERLWWECASKTKFYTDFLEELVYNEIDSCFIENTIRNLEAEKRNLYELVLKMKDFLDN